MKSNLYKVYQTINHIETEPSETFRFIPDRFPWTYAFDFMRMHPERFQTNNASRANASARLKELVPDEEERRHAAVLLAAAYIKENRINMGRHSITGDQSAATDRLVADMKKGMK